MKILNKAVATVFAGEGENIEEIQSALLKLFPLDLEKEKKALQRQTAKGFEDKKVVILKLELEKPKHTNAFIKNLLKNLSTSQKEMLLSQAESRLDENLHFFIRLDKTKLLRGEYEITERGDCFHIKMHIAAFPSKRAVALAAIEKLLKPR